MPAATDLAQPPLAVYVHLPWCVRKCPYCDFNSHPLRDPLPATEYVDALLADIDHDLPLAGDREIVSVFLGGGTPSLFRADQVDRLLSGLSGRLRFADSVEISLEANPGTIERDSFTAYAQAGINRVSLGVQSFNDRRLRALGRIHDRSSIHDALDSLARSGIANFNLDLMFGLPGQSVSEGLDDLQAALAAEPAHLSHYQLTLEPNTAFARTPPELPGEEACWAMQEQAAGYLRAAGFGQYEISAWSRPGSECVHNLNYWRYGDFIGIGAGAHGKLTEAETGTVIRTTRPRQPRLYLEGGTPPTRQRLGPDDLVFEFFLNRLRLLEGFTSSDFTSRTGLPWSRVGERVSEGVERGLLARTGERYRATDLGWRFVNDVQAMFLP